MKETIRRKALRDAASLVNAKPAHFMVVVLVVTLPMVFWLNQGWCSSVFQRVGVTLFDVSFLWASVCMLQVNWRGDKLGWKRSHFTRLISGPCPSDPDESLIWQWARQACYAFLAALLSVILLAFVGR